MVLNKTQEMNGDGREEKNLEGKRRIMKKNKVLEEVVEEEEDRRI